MVREIKLAEITGVPNPKVDEVNKFFSDLFENIEILTDSDKPDLIFFKDGKFLMEQDLKNGMLWCSYRNLWSKLREQFLLTRQEIKELIQYMMARACEMGSLTPFQCELHPHLKMARACEMGSLTPLYQKRTRSSRIERAYEMGSLTPSYLNSLSRQVVEKAYEMKIKKQL